MKILMVGLGSIGQRHTLNLKKLGFNDIIAYRSSKGNLKFCEENSITQYWTLDEAIKQKPECVFITNPTSLHVAVAIKILEKTNCHLFIEKPLSNSMDGIKQLQAILNSRDLQTMIGYNMRFHPLLLKTKEIIDSSQIGEIVGYRTIWGEFLPNWHPWEDYKKGYSARSELGGGSLLTLSHDIDLAVWLFGKIVETKGFQSSKHVLKTTADECSIITTKHEDGVIGSLFFDYLQDPPKRTLEIIASKGKLFWDYYEGQLIVYDRIKQKSKIHSNPEGFERNTMFLEEVKHFMNCIQNQSKPMITLADGIEVLKVIEPIM